MRATSAARIKGPSAQGISSGRAALRALRGLAALALPLGTLSDPMCQGGRGGGLTVPTLSK